MPKTAKAKIDCGSCTLISLELLQIFLLFLQAVHIIQVPMVWLLIPLYILAVLLIPALFAGAFFL